MTDETDKPGSKPLQNVRHELFAQNMVGWGFGNQTEAARRAGYAERSAPQQGHALMRNPKISERVKYLRDEFFEKHAMSRNELLAFLGALPRGAGIRNLFKENGSHKLPHELDDATAMAVAGIETELTFGDDGAPPTVVRKYKMRPIDGVLRMIAQHHKVIGADVNANIQTDLASRMERARRRAKEGR